MRPPIRKTPVYVVQRGKKHKAAWEEIILFIVLECILVCAEFSFPIISFSAIFGSRWILWAITADSCILTMYQYLAVLQLALLPRNEVPAMRRSSQRLLRERCMLGS